MLPRRRKDDPLRDLDRDGDIDAGDNRIDDLNNDGRIDANDRDIRDLDGDNDIDATDRRLELERAQGQSQDQTQSQSHSSTPDNSAEEEESLENELAPEAPTPSVGEALGLKKNEDGTWQHKQSQSLSTSLRQR